MSLRVLVFGAVCAGLLLGGCGGGSDGPTSATISQSQFAVTATQGESSPYRSAMINMENVPRDGVYYDISMTRNGLQAAELVSVSRTAGRLDIWFETPGFLAAGTYTDTIELTLCVDMNCRRPVRGSPMRVTTTFTVNAAPGGIGPDPEPEPEPEPEWPELAVLSRAELGHDVIDAVYSAALDAIVMVSSRPSNALHIYFPQQGTSRQIALPKVPTAVAVAPDGRSVAVGHDALVSYLDLGLLDEPGVPEVQALPVSVRVGDLAVDGRGFVHIIPAVDQWVQVISVELATGEESAGDGSVYAGGRVAMHPSGESIYVASRGLSPSKIERFEVSSGRAENWRSSPYHGTYEACGDLWISEPGDIIYTACGNTFRASSNAATDMTYTGALVLSFGDYAWDSRITSLSQSAAAREILVVEQPAVACLPHLNWPDCRTRISIHESDFLNRSDIFEMPRIEINSQRYRQDALFVFHSANGAHRYLVSRLFGAPAEPHYVSVLQ